MNTANWIPDLFMRRVMEKGTWTLFSPSNVPDLHDLFGAEFEKAYVAYEAKAASGELKPSKTVQATDLWRKILTMLFETGHPWITFKDACNVALAPATRWRGALVQPVHGNHAQHQRHRNSGVQPGAR